MADDDLYFQQKELIDSVISACCRLHRLIPDQADEFRSWAQVRLLDHGQAILRKFGHRSSWRTFLVTVVERLYLDWRNHEWGKWRPSSEARRLGELAIELERAILRDRCTFDEAAHAMIARGLAESRRDCERAWARLPRHPRRHRVDEEALSGLPAAGAGRDPVEAEEQRQQAKRLIEALEQAMTSLPPADQAILRLRYWSGVKVSRIAVTTGQDQKHLYRRFERILAELRRRLEAEGKAGQLADVFDEFDPDDGADGDGDG